MGQNFAYYLKFLLSILYIIGGSGVCFGQTGNIKVEVKITNVYANDFSNNPLGEGDNEYRWKIYLGGEFKKDIKIKSGHALSNGSEVNEVVIKYLNYGNNVKLKMRAFEDDCGDDSEYDSGCDDFYTVRSKDINYKDIEPGIWQKGYHLGGYHDKFELDYAFKISAPQPDLPLVGDQKICSGEKADQFIAPDSDLDPYVAYYKWQRVEITQNCDNESPYCYECSVIADPVLRDECEINCVPEGERCEQVENYYDFNNQNGKTLNYSVIEGEDVSDLVRFRKVYKSGLKSDWSNTNSKTYEYYQADEVEDLHTNTDGTEKNTNNYCGSGEIILTADPVKKSFGLANHKFIWERKLDESNWQTLATTEKETFTDTDTDGFLGHEVQYRFRTKNTNCDQEYSLWAKSTPIYTWHPPVEEADLDTTIVDASCGASSDGKIILNGFNTGAEFLYYNIDFGNSKFSIGPYQRNESITFPDAINDTTAPEGLAEGTYTIQVVNADKYESEDGTIDDLQNNTGQYCFRKFDIKVGVKTPWDISNVQVKENASCPDGNDGIIEVKATGGEGKKKFMLYKKENGGFDLNNPLEGTDWIEEENFGEFHHLSQGFYKVRIKGEGQCLLDESGEITITQPDPLNLSSTDIIPTSVSCKGSSDGSLELNFQGGVSEYTISLIANDSAKYNQQTSTVSNVHTFSGLGEGSYDIEVEDACGDLQAVRNVMVGAPPELNLKTDIINHITCNGISDGAVSLTASGGMGDYKFKLDNQSWLSSEDNTFNFDGLAKGDHTLFLQDANGCTTTKNVTIFEPTELTLDFVDNPPSCAGASDGVFTVSASGGKYPDGSSAISQFEVKLVTESNYHEVSLGGNEYTFNGLKAGQYSIMVRDANNPDCYRTMDHMLTEPDPIALETKEAITPDCEHGNNGQFILQASGGSPGETIPYYYSLDGKDFYATNSEGTFTTKDTLEAGQYTFYIRDGNFEKGNPATQNCMKSFQFNLEDPDPVQVFTSAKKISCFGTNTGSITIDSVKGGAGEFSYQWYYGNNINDGNKLDFADPFQLQKLSAGTYRLRVADKNGCVAYHTEIVESPQQPLKIQNLKTYPVSCKGRADGKVQVLEVNGGYPPYTYQLEDAPFTQNNFFDNFETSQAPYTLTVRDAGGCEVSSEFFIEVEDPLISVKEKQPISCFGGEDGSFTLENSGVDNISYYLEGEINPSGVQFNNLTAGDHRVTIDYNSGCSKDTVIHVSQPNAPLSAGYAILQKDGYCSNTRFGKIEITAEGGTPPYEFNFNDRGYISGHVVENIEAGDYSMKIRDAKGCQIGMNVTIPSMEKPEIAIEILDSAACDLANGKVKARVNEGIGPYKFYWDENNAENFDSIAYGLNAGDHQLLVKDSLGCVFEKSFTLEKAALPAVSIEVLQKPYCEKPSGQLEVHYENIKGEPDINWLDNNNNLLDTTRQLDNIPVGKYSVKVMGENGCIVTKEIQLEELPAPAIELVAYDSSGCNLNNGLLEVQLINGTAKRYIWQHDSTMDEPVAKNLPAGVYSVTIEDSRGCRVNTQFAMADEQALTASVIQKEKTYCDLPMGTIEVAASGGASPYTYQWDDPESQTGSRADSLSSGRHIVRVKDAKGCVFPLQVTIENHAPPVIELKNKKNTYCGLALGQVEVEVNGGNGPFNYQWYDSDDSLIQKTPRADSLASGIYSVIAYDKYGCASNPLEIHMEEDASPNIDLLAKSKTYCGLAKGSAAVEVTGGQGPYQYRWDNGETGPEASRLRKGIHAVVAQDANGCQVKLNVNIQESPQPYLSLENVMPSACGMNYGSATVVAHGGQAPYTFQWDDPQMQTEHTATRLYAGKYQVTATDANGCVFTLDVTIPDRAPISIQTTNVSQPGCFDGNGGSIEVNVMGGTPPYQYQWKGYPEARSNNINNIKAGIYEVSVTDSLGCKQSHQVKLSEPDSMQVVNVNAHSPTCNMGNDGSLALSVIGGTPPYQYQWNEGKISNNPTIKNISAGNHWVTITDNQGCQLQKQIPLENPKEIPDILALDSVVICKGQPYKLDAGAEWSSYSWNSDLGFTSHQQQVTLSKSGIYTIRTTNSEGCATIDTFKLVTDEQPMTVKFLTPSEIIAGDTIVLTDVTWPAPNNLVWEYPDSIEHVTSTKYKEVLILPESGTFTLKMKAFLGNCMGIMEKTISVSPDSAVQVVSNARFGFKGIEDVNIFPNPNDGVFTLEIFLARKEDLLINIIGAYGKFVYRNQLKNTDYFKKEINLSGIRGGVYVGGIKVGEDFKSFRFIKR